MQGLFASTLNPTQDTLQTIFVYYSFSSLYKVFVLNPKQDLYGLGYDPFKHAPEFRGTNCSYYCYYLLESCMR